MEGGGGWYSECVQLFTLAPTGHLLSGCIVEGCPRVQVEVDVRW